MFFPNPYSDAEIAALLLARVTALREMGDKALMLAGQSPNQELSDAMQVVAFYAGLRLKNAETYGSGGKADTTHKVTAKELVGFIQRAEAEQLSVTELARRETVQRESVQRSDRKVMRHVDSGMHRRRIMANIAPKKLGDAPLNPVFRLMESWKKTPEDAQIQAEIQEYLSLAGYDQIDIAGDSCRNSHGDAMTIAKALFHQSKPCEGVLFNRKNRIYYPLKSQAIAGTTQVAVIEALAKAGYDLEDYKQGYCMGDDGQKRRITPILQAMERDAILEKLEGHGFRDIDFSRNRCVDKHGETKRVSDMLSKYSIRSLVNEFAADPARHDDLVLVISRDCADLVRKATRRAWGSCLSVDNVDTRYLENEQTLGDYVTTGSLVAYVVTKNDPTIQNPLCAMFIKPFHSIEGQTIYRVEQPFGLAIPAAVRMVEQIIETQVNYGKQGEFVRDNNFIMDDSWPRKIVREWTAENDAKMTIREGSLSHFQPPELS